MKALPSEPQAEAVARVLDQERAWRRTLIYSTDAAYQQAFSAFPQARLFESRDATRKRLATLALADSPQTMLAIKDGMRRSALHCPEPLSATQ
jgi:glycerophosphoryl diester phosphodiesterase